MRCKVLSRAALTFVLLVTLLMGAQLKVQRALISSASPQVSSLIHPLWAQPAPSHVVNIWLSEKQARCPQQIPLSAEGQLLFELPFNVKVAAPTEPSLVQVHIAPQLVVVRVREPKAWGASLGVGLSFVFEQGGTLYCDLTPTPQGALKLKATPQEPRNLVVRVRELEPALKQERAALELLERVALGEPSAQGAEVSLAERELQQSLERLKAQWLEETLLSELARRPLTLSQAPPIRAQDNLIYVTLTQRFWLQTYTWIRVELINRSQPSFELSELTLEREGRAPHVVTRRPSQLTLPPDAQPRALSLSLPRALLSDHTLAPTLVFKAKDGRVVRVSLPEEL